MKVAFTLCSLNYMAQAKTLAESFREHNPDWHFVIGLVDELTDTSLLPNFEDKSVEIIPVHKVQISRLNDMAEAYNIEELNTSVKPFYIEFLFVKYNADKVVYIDPDIQVYDSISDVDQQLNVYDLILTPHFLTPLDDDGKCPSEINILRVGIFNLGFVAFKNTPMTLTFIQWWKDRLSKYCFVAPNEGMFVDQLWMNFAILYHERSYILRHLGYNVANWNLHERNISKKGNRFFINDTYPLVFFHFSGYTPLKPDVISKYQNRFDFNNRKDIIELFDGYRERLFKNDFTRYSKLKCSFSKDNSHRLTDKISLLLSKSIIKIARMLFPIQTKRLFFPRGR
jgi:hypothetical protein